MNKKVKTDKGQKNKKKRKYVRPSLKVHISFETKTWGEPGDDPPSPSECI